MKEKNILKGLKMSDKIREQRLNVSLTWKCHGKVETLSSDRFVKPLLYECGKKLSYFSCSWTCYRASFSTESAVNYSGCEPVFWTKNRVKESHINIFYVRTSLRVWLKTSLSELALFESHNINLFSCYIINCLDCNIQSIFSCAALYQIFQLFKLIHF